MTPNTRRFLYLILLNIFGTAFLLLPLLGVAISLKYKYWICALLSLLAFYVFKRLLFAVENRLGVRSLGNPESRIHGSGITIIAPWLRSKAERRKKAKNR
jgi:hypothetical protein